MRKWDVFLRFGSFDSPWLWWPSVCWMPEERAVDVLWGWWALTLGVNGAYRPEEDWHEVEALATRTLNAIYHANAKAEREGR